MYSGKITPEEIEPYKSTEEIIQAIRHIKALDRETTPESQLEVLLYKLTNSKYIIHPIGIWLTNYRLVRVRESLARNINQILAPIPPHSRYGRCNLKDTCVYYAAKNLETALLECQAKIGDTFQVVKMTAYNSPQSVSSIYIGQYDEYRRTRLATYPIYELSKRYQEDITKLYDKVGPKEFLQFAYIDAFLSDEFRKNVQNDYDYKLTALMAKFFLDFDMVDQIVYPSVAYRNSINLAIKPSIIGTKYTLDRIYAIRVLNDYDYGIFSYEEYADGIKQENGDIKWVEIPKEINNTF
ncbi:MAG: RES domain-containing protein [Sphaerochaeta sp.]